MYVDPWIFWLMLAPLGAVSAVYVGYLLLLLTGLLSLTIGMGLTLAGDGLHTFINWLAACYARGIGCLVRPFRHYGPWLDYAVVAALLVSASVGAVLWLAA